MLTEIEMDNPEALGKYYHLILSITRVICSVVLSRGLQNKQTLDQAKSFLMENRALVVAIFKRQAGVGAVTFEGMGVNMDGIAELFVLLITITGFLDVRGALVHPYRSMADSVQYEEERDTQKIRTNGFS